MALPSPSRRSFSLLSSVVVLLAAVLALSTCSSDNPVEAPPVTGDGTVGPAGGTVSDATGASVIIPPGALSSDVKVTVEGFPQMESAPYPAGPVPVFWGGAQFGPAGTQFAQPVSISLPTGDELNPGDDYQLFVYDPDNSRWVIEKTPAVVDPSGHKLVAQVSHFSLFGGSGMAGGSAARSAITDLLCSFPSPLEVCEAYAAYFKEYVAKVGDMGVWDGQCKEVCGLYMDLTCEVNGVEEFLPVREGELEGREVMVYDPENCGFGDNMAMFEAISIIYYRCAQPDLTVTADPGEIELGGASTVMGTLICGTVPFPDQTVQFECFGVGQVDHDEAVTSPAGQAQVMYTNDEATGEATVRGYYDACEGELNAGTVTSAATIVTSGDWHGTMTVHYDHPVGDEPLEGFADVVTIDFGFTIDEEDNLTGSGSGSHSATVTPSGSCWQSSLDAPDFSVVAAGGASAHQMNFLVYPNPAMPVEFVITCPNSEGTTDYSYPGEGYLEGSILTQDIHVSVAREDGATASGSGSSDWGEDIPMSYSWSVIIHKGGS